MIRLNIKAENQGEFYKDFSTQAELDAYVAEVTASQHWGKSAYTETIDAVVDENGVEISPAQTINHAATWSYTSQDLTAQLLAEKEKAEALAYLQSTDWYVVRNAETGVAVPEEITQARALARTKVIS